MDAFLAYFTYVLNALQYLVRIILEREMISEALKSTHGNMAKAAIILGTTERLIGLRVKKFGINLANCKGGLPDLHSS